MTTNQANGSREADALRNTFEQYCRNMFDYGSFELRRDLHEHYVDPVTVYQWNLYQAGYTALSSPQSAPVYLVATGETYEGRETYTRHDSAPANCDCELLYSAPRPQSAPESMHWLPLAEVALNDHECFDLWLHDCKYDGDYRIKDAMYSPDDGAFFYRENGLRLWQKPDSVSHVLRISKPTTKGADAGACGYCTGGNTIDGKTCKKCYGTGRRPTSGALP